VGKGISKAISDCRFQIGTPVIHRSRFSINNLKSEINNLKSEISNLKSEIKNLKSKI